MVSRRLEIINFGGGFEHGPQRARAWTDLGCPHPAMDLPMPQDRLGRLTAIVCTESHIPSFSSLAICRRARDSFAVALHSPSENWSRILLLQLFWLGLRAISAVMTYTFHLGNTSRTASCI